MRAIMMRPLKINEEKVVVQALLERYVIFTTLVLFSLEVDSQGNITGGWGNSWGGSSNQSNQWDR